MAIRNCPKCNKPIVSLRWYGAATGDFYPDDKFGARLEDMWALNGGPDEFECPRCREVLFEDWEEAVKFFKE